MNVILIDAINHSVSAQIIEDGKFLAGAYRLIGCDMIEFAHDIEHGNPPVADTIYVDEEGLLKACDHFFYYKGAHAPFAGNGLVVGFDPETGESNGTNMTVDQVRNAVRFLNRAEALVLADEMGT
jgi:hypothetical protein